MYQHTSFGSISRLSDGAVIPAERGNGDYEDYLQYVSDGGETLPPPPPAPVTSVTMKQARKALILSGINLAEVDALIAALPEPDRSLARVDWEYSLMVELTNPLVQHIATAKGWDHSQLMALFALGGTLS